MNRLKDLFYDTSDILTAMLILACAALIIITHVDTLITYPEKMISDQSVKSGHIRPDIPDAPDVSAPAADGDDGDDGDDVEGDEEEITSHSLYISYGESMDNVAKDLVQLGLFENRQAFTAALDKHNAGSRVQAGTFIIPADATEDDVIKIITGIPHR